MDFIKYIFDIFSSEFSFVGYIILMLVAASEATPMFGFFVPGQLVAILSGILAKIGTVKLLDTIVVLSVGAVLGDLISYYLGNKYGESFILKYGKYFYLKKENFEKTKELISTHAGKSIIIGRFNSITRALTPFAAGSVNVPIYKFIFYDIIGGISWAITFCGLGYLFGNNYKAITNYFGEFFVIAFLVGALIIYTYKRINKKRRIFQRRHLYALLINLFALYVFSKMLENFVEQDILINFDLWLNLQLASIQTPLLNQVLTFITHLASTTMMIIGGLILLAFFISKKKWRYSLILTCSMFLGKGAEVFIKQVIGRDRPLNPIIEADGYSFPSGHATIAIIFYLILAYYFKNHIKNKNIKYLLMSLCLSIILAVGFSRIYLGAHWYSDVIAGYALGLFCFTLMVLILEFITTVFKEKVIKIKNYLNR